MIYGIGTIALLSLLGLVFSFGIYEIVDDDDDDGRSADLESF